MQKSEDIVSLTLWLKQLLKLHWGTLLQKSDQTSFESLLSLKHFIEAKSKHLSEILVVKGKLEMLKNCYQVQDASQKYWKIKSNIKKLKDGDDEDEALIYQDQSDDEGDLGQIIDENMDESEEDEYDEEFEQIDIKKQKREDGDDMEDDDAEMFLDDSVSEDKPKKTKRKADESEDEYASEEQDINDYGDSSADEVSEDEKAMRKRLVQESDDEGELQAQGGSSDEMSDI